MGTGVSVVRNVASIHDEDYPFAEAAFTGIRSRGEGGFTVVESSTVEVRTGRDPDSAPVGLCANEAGGTVVARDVDVYLEDAIRGVHVKEPDPVQRAVTLSDVTVRGSSDSEETHLRPFRVDDRAVLERPRLDLPNSRGMLVLSPCTIREPVADVDGYDLALYEGGVTVEDPDVGRIHAPESIADVDLRGDLSDVEVTLRDAERVVRNGWGTNDGDPAETGEWHDRGYDGLQVRDVDGGASYVHLDGEWVAQ